MLPALCPGAFNCALLTDAKSRRLHASIDLVFRYILALSLPQLRAGADGIFRRHRRLAEARARRRRQRFISPRTNFASNRRTCGSAARRGHRKSLATQTSTVLMAQQHMYMEMPAQAQSQRMSYTSAFFRAGDVENACGDWQKMRNTTRAAAATKWATRSVNGRSTVKYEATKRAARSATSGSTPSCAFR